MVKEIEHDAKKTLAFSPAYRSIFCTLFRYQHLLCKGTLGVLLFMRAQSSTEVICSRLLVARTGIKNSDHERQNFQMQTLT
jgi:hypothetical protein